MMTTGLFCLGAFLLLVSVGILALKVAFSPVRAVVSPCAFADVPGLTSSPDQSAVENFGFGVYEPFGARALMGSFRALGFQPSGALVIRNSPLPDMFVALMTRPDADVRVWIQPDGEPGPPSVISATAGVRVVTSGTAEAASQHDREDVEAFPDASPLAIVQRHEERMVGRTALEHSPDGAVERYLTEWRDDLAAMKRKSVLARMIGWFSPAM